MKTLTFSFGIAVVTLKMMFFGHHQPTQGLNYTHLDLVSACEGGVRRLTEHRVVVSGLTRDGLR